MKKHPLLVVHATLGEREELLHRHLSENDKASTRKYKIALVVCALSLLLTMTLTAVTHGRIQVAELNAVDSEPDGVVVWTSAQYGNNLPDGIAPCTFPPCFVPAKIRADDSRPGVPTFWKYAHQGPLNVGYDNRAMKLNGERVLLLGGSMHPSRATAHTWSHALDEAVQHGLNLITIYVMWSAHQPIPSAPLDWGFPGSYGVQCSFDGRNGTDCHGWNLASSIRAAAERGLFVHLRVGPYDCAEYNYGGIPEWLPFAYPNIVMRRPNRPCLIAMEGFVTSLVAYITQNQLWAHQGGNIIMAQIENELGEDGATEDYSITDILLVDEMGNFVDRDANPKPPGMLRNATLQDYAEWSGKLGQRLAPNVTWTMCNGLSANNTILTANAIGDGDKWLEDYGGNGHIQIDQPAIFTEFEGGFQVWGESPEAPTDYFWGRTARAMARDAMKWFARGGTHLNYYMWWGGYNRGRSAAAGITNRYASDVALCPSGERREPKYGHFRSFHQAIIGVAPTLLEAQTALGRSHPLKHKDSNGNWAVGKEQRMFEYETVKTCSKQVIFVENDADHEVMVAVPIHGEQSQPTYLTMSPQSAVLLVNGVLEFDSGAIDPRAMSYSRIYSEGETAPRLLDWSSWQEPIGSPNDLPSVVVAEEPIEHVRLSMMMNDTSSDYIWYETSLEAQFAVKSTRIFIDTQMANGFLAFLDDEYVGAADNHLHKEGFITLTLNIGALSAGSHKLSLLSESLGFSNLIGRWGGSTIGKFKGITGDVFVSFGSERKNVSLVDGREWRSFFGLHGEAVNRDQRMSRPNLQERLLASSPSSSSPSWASALFDTPRYDPTSQHLLLRLIQGRGHIWLNGRDLGRYWNITRGETGNRSQEYYQLPYDFLYKNGDLNEIVMFDSFGQGSHESANLVLSWIDATDSPNFMDEVDYPEACI